MILPNQDRLVIKRIDIEQKSEGGIILTGTEQGNEVDVAYGQILHVGPGKDGAKPPTGVVGDIIAFNPRQPMKWVYKGEELWILRDSDVFVFLRDENLEIKKYSDATSDFKGLGPKMLG